MGSSSPPKMISALSNAGALWTRQNVGVIWYVTQGTFCP